MHDRRLPPPRSATNLTVSSSSPRRSPYSTDTMVAKGSLSLSIFTTGSGMAEDEVPLAVALSAALRQRGQHPAGGPRGPPRPHMHANDRMRIAVAKVPGSSTQQTWLS